MKNLCIICGILFFSASIVLVGGLFEYSISQDNVAPGVAEVDPGAAEADPGVAKVDLGPAEIDLSKIFEIPKKTQKSVFFPHAFHQQNMEEDCEICHMTAEGGKALKDQRTGKLLTPGKLVGVGHAVHQKYCWLCHRKMKVPKGTTRTTCHK